jgi:Fic family protein
MVDGDIDRLFLGWEGSNSTTLGRYACAIGELMSDIERFVHNDTQYFAELLKIALVHYQFETIHSFLDGNGRVGRLLITLYLFVGAAYPTDNRGILKQPVLYLSDFFERNRTNYYDNLMRARGRSHYLGSLN